MTIDSCSRRWMMNGITLFFSVGIIVVCAGNVSAQQLLTITTGTLPGGVVGVQYSQTLSATGGVLPYTWSIVSGSLPQGITLNPVAGTLSGTPANVGTSNFRVRVASLQQRDEKDFSIRVDPVLTITTSTLPAGTVGSTYSRGLLATGGTAPYAWSIASGSLPQGLSLSGATIGGTPSAAGTFTFTVRVTDSGQPGQTKQASMSIVINPAALGITTASLPAARVGTVYSQSLAASGGTSPYTWSIASGNLPAGLALNGAIISGTPTTQGTSNFALRVRDAGTPQQTAQQDFTIVTNPPSQLRITTLILPVGIQGSAYIQQLDALGGPSPYTWAVINGTLPPGLVLTPAGVLQGTPTTIASATIRVRVLDSSGANDMRDFTLNVGPPIGQLGLTGAQGTVNPAGQVPLVLSLPSGYPYAVQGVLNLAFRSAAVAPADDPAVQFSTGGRTVTFTFPANGTTAVFPSPFMLLTGTVAGTITISGSIQNGSSGVQVASINVQSVAPPIVSVEASRISGGLRVLVSGYSPERRVTDIEFGFDVRMTSSTTQRIALNKVVEPEFKQWYESTASLPFGSTFVFEQIFGVEGDAAAIEAVTISLRNGQGTTTSSRTPIP